MNKRVVVTGLGVVCSAGNNIAEFTKNISSGTACFSKIENQEVSHFRASYAGLVKKLEVTKKELLSQDRFVQLAHIAGSEALNSSGLNPKNINHRMGFVLGTCSGPMLSIENHYRKIVNGNPQINSKELFVKRYYSGAKILASLFDISGFSTTITTACSSSLGALGIAMDSIIGGIADVILVGGADSFSTTTLAGFDGLKATSESICAPFSKPIGLNLGEGGAFLVVESLEHAINRNAKIIAEISGYGLSNDAYHCSAPDPSGRGQSLAMKRALAHSGVNKDLIEYVNAHGTGTGANDKAETKAVIKTLGTSIPVSSTKSMVGHCLGAAGALELIASIVCAQKNVYPPTANFTEPRDGCSLDYVPDVGREWNKNKIFMSNSFAFGGNNASVVVKCSDIKKSNETNLNKSKKIVITSCGIVTSAGVGIDALVDAVNAGRSLNISVKSDLNSNIKIGKIPEFDVRKIDRRLDLRNMDMSSQYAVIASKLALTESGYSWRPRESSELGFYLSLSAGPSKAEEEHIESIFKNNFKINQVNAFPYIVPNSVAGNVSRSLMLTGHNTVFNGGPDSALMSVALGTEAIKSGHTESFLCGGVDELSDRIIADGVSANIWNNKTFPAEASAMFLLEEETIAQKKNAKILASVEGYAFSTETSELFFRNKNPDKLSDTISRALKNANISEDEIKYICLDKNDDLKHDAVSKLFDIGSNIMIVDISNIIGKPECTFGLINLAYLLNTISRGEVNEEKYILVISSSPYGNNNVLILKS